jgi:hypothetical protein
VGPNVLRFITDVRRSRYIARLVYLFIFLRISGKTANELPADKKALTTSV